MPSLKMAKAVPQEDEGMASHQPSSSHEILLPGHAQGTRTLISPPHLNRFLLSGQARRQRLNDTLSTRNTKGRSTASTSDFFGGAGPGCPDGETGLAGWASDESNTGGLHMRTHAWLPWALDGVCPPLTLHPGPSGARQLLPAWLSPLLAVLPAFSTCLAEGARQTSRPKPEPKCEMPKCFLVASLEKALCQKLLRGSRWGEFYWPETQGMRCDGPSQQWHGDLTFWAALGLCWC